MNKNIDPIVIVGAARTPIGCLLGQFAELPSPQLGAYAIAASLERAKCALDSVDEVYMGCVLSAGIGQAPARQAARFAHLPDRVSATTINKMCGSGMQAVILAHDRLRAGSVNVVVAGGQESMTRAPYLLSKARAGYRFGHGQLQDHMLLDGLEDAYDQGKAMGYFAEMTAKKYGYSRETQDEYAIRSLQRAVHSVESGAFVDEIVPIETRQGVVAVDEGPGRVKVEKIPKLPPVFVEGGTVTAANSSAISDGAAALVLMRESHANQLKLQPLARIVGHLGIAQAPAWFTTAPVVVIDRLLQTVNWSKDSVDYFEINEAFAVVALHAIRELSLDINKVNVRGGACVLGHPIGATGARIIVTLLYTLMQNQAKRGVAALCIGGGEATAVALERL